MRLLTWNTQWCCGLDGTVSPQRIVEHARSLIDFDVLCLQEIALNYPRLQGNPGHDQPALIAELLPGFQVFFGPSVDEWDGHGQRSRFGNLIATRLPPLQLQHHPLPYPADPGVCSMPRMCTVLTVRDPELGPVRVMTTHLEYYSQMLRMTQARALRDLHLEYSEQAATPPQAPDDGSPYRTKAHTAQAVLCGDFNLEAAEPEYAAITASGGVDAWHDSWELLHGEAPHPPTFRLYDRTYGPEPVACDFVFVSTALRDKVRSFRVDPDTKASDHQPLAVEIG